MSGSSSLPPRGLILLGPLKKACRRAPRALSCFIRRSLDLLFWNQTWEKTGRRQTGQRLLQSPSITDFFIFPFNQTSSISCRRQIQILITIATRFRPLLSARRQNWKQINTYRLDTNPDRFEVISLIYSISCSLLQSSRRSHNSHRSWNAEVSLTKSETFLENKIKLRFYANDRKYCLWFLRHLSDLTHLFSCSWSSTSKWLKNQ